jgi:hypothetical protein
MPKVGNPWDIPEWHFIGREAALVRSLIGSGVTALGTANYADRTGEYYTAFFGLSVGLERLAKLVLVADHAISNAGAMPRQDVIKQYGHRLRTLVDKSDEVARKRSLELQFQRPTHEISEKVIECLDAFADAAKGRYANFAALGDPNLGVEEPISKWWNEVAELILQNYYYGKPVQQRVEARAKVVDALMSPVSLVHHTSETGTEMRDVLSASIRTGQTDLVQKYGRYHALLVVRWLSEVFSELALLASALGFDAFYGVWEYFQTYTVEESFLRTRKKWPL